MNRRKAWLIAMFRVTAACAVVAIVGYYYYVKYTVAPGEAPAGPRSSLPPAFQPVLPEPPGEPVLNRIALVGKDFQIFTVSPDGEDLLQITDAELRFALPTWSLDGRRLAFTGLAHHGYGGLFVSPSSRGAPTLLAPSRQVQPIYLNWAPDSASIAYIISEGRGLALREVKLSNPESNRRRGISAGHHYWAWSPDAEGLLSHPRGNLILNRQEKTTRLVKNDAATRLFAAPAYSSDGKTAYYVASDAPNEPAIMALDTQKLTSKKVSSVKGYCRLVLSPDNRYLAYVQTSGMQPPLTGPAHLIDLTTGEKSTPVNFDVAAIFFSPDGKRMALLTPLQEAQAAAVLPGGEDASREGRPDHRDPMTRDVRYQWWVYDLATGESAPVASLRLTRILAILTLYYDQMYPSHSFWSPDSRSLVTASQPLGQGATAQVWVLDADGKKPPLAVADGRFAVWSPQ